MARSGEGGLDSLFWRGVDEFGGAGDAEPFLAPAFAFGYHGWILGEGVVPGVWASCWSWSCEMVGIDDATMDCNASRGC